MDVTNWGGGAEVRAFVMLDKGSLPDKINAQLADMTAKNIKMDEGTKVTLGLQPLSELHFNTNYDDMYARKAHLPTLYILMGIAGFILILAAINFINLSSAQSVEDRKNRHSQGARAIDAPWYFNFSVSFHFDADRHTYSDIDGAGYSCFFSFVYS